MLSRLCLFLAVCLVWAAPAHACKYEAQPLEQAAAAAEVVFVGTVKNSGGGKVELHIEKSIKGAKDGETLAVDVPSSDCAVRFLQGQRWLYLGVTQPAGSLLLADEYGRPQAGNITAAAKLLGGAVPDSRDLHRGRLDFSCAPDASLYAGTTPAAPQGYSAIGITIDNGYSAGIYVPLDVLDSKPAGQVITYTADGKHARGHAMILQCHPLKAGEKNDNPCQSVSGSVSIGDTSPGEATGNIELADHSRFVFRVTRTPKPADCQ
jgi:hypothetical protein